MKNTWVVVNIIAVALAAWTGFAELAPERLVHTNPEAALCAAALIGMVLFSLLSVWLYLRRSGEPTLRRPSWQRLFLSRDPLQHLFFICCFFGAMALGASFRLRGTSQIGFWMFMVFVSLFVGLLIGRGAVYVVYRDHIAET